MRTQRALSKSFASGARGLALFGLATITCACGAKREEPAGPATGAAVLTDDHNYWSRTSLTIPVEQTAADDTDFEICWGDVTKNLQCHDIVPEDVIVKVMFLAFNGMDQDEVTELLNSGVDPDPSTFLTYETDGSATCANLTDFNVPGNDEPLDPEEIFGVYKEGDATFLLTFDKSITLGTGAQSMLFLEPDSSVDFVEVAATSGCDDPPMLDYEVDIASKDTLEIPADGPWIVDWSQVTTDSVGNPIPSNKIDRLLLGFYADQSVEDIEEDIYNIELNENLWELDFEDSDSAVTSADLEDVTPVDSAPDFDGFDMGDGTWMVAIMCSTCPSPAPIILTVLEPYGAD